MYTNLYRSDPIQSTKKKKESKLKFPRNTKVSILSPEEHEAKKLYWKQSKQLLKNRKKMAEEDELSRNFENLMKEIHLKEVKLDELKIASPAMIFTSPQEEVQTEKFVDQQVKMLAWKTSNHFGPKDWYMLRRIWKISSAHIKLQTSSYQ